MVKEAKVCVALSGQRFRKKSQPVSWLVFVGGLVDHTESYGARLARIEDAKEMEQCRQTMIPQVCAYNPEHYYAVRRLCKQRALCDCCSRVKTFGETEDFIRYVKTASDALRVRVMGIEYLFTVPADKRLSVDDLTEFAALAQSVWDKRCHFVLGAQADSWQFAGEHGVQYWSSSNPGVGYRPHLHGLMVSVYWDRAKRCFGSLSKHQLYLMTMDNDGELRACWKAALTAFYGKTSAKEVYCGARYRPTYANIRHDASYLSRGVVEDVFKYVTTAKEPEDWNPLWLQTMRFRPKGEHRIVRFGWLQNCVREKRMRSLGLPCAMCGHLHKGTCSTEVVGLRATGGYPAVYRPCGCHDFRTMVPRKQWDIERRRLFCPACGAEGRVSVLLRGEGSMTFEECQGKGIPLVSVCSTVEYR